MSQPPRIELAPGYSIASVINGCWQLAPDHGGGPDSDKAVMATFDALVDHGFTTFDCADIYLGVEEAIGRFRRRLGDAGAIQVHTKYVPDKAALETLRPSDVDAAIDRSRRRLGMEQLDLVQFHWWRYDVAGLDLVIDRLQELQAKGSIRFLGLTNFDTAHVEAMVSRGAPIVSLQAQYSLLDRRPQRCMTALAARTAVRLLPYGSLAGGFLSDQYLGLPAPEAASAGNRSLTKYRLIIDEAGGWDAFQGLLRLLQEIACKHCVSLSTVAARWVLDQPEVAAIILGTSRRPRIDERLALASLVLDQEDRSALAGLLAQRPVPPGDMYELERDPDGMHAGIIKTDLNRVGAGDGAAASRQASGPGAKPSGGNASRS
jgi:aryl-alcohol dehydrogenase-like predicted oxidoreductase